MGSNSPPGGTNNGVTLPERSVSQQTVQSTALAISAVGNTQNVSGPIGSHESVATVSNSHEASSRNAETQRRLPRTLQGLLQFAMQATQAEDAPGNTDRAPMDEERRRFLEEALRSLTVNVTEVLDNAIKVLTNQEKLSAIKEGEPLPDEVKNSFTILLDHVDDMDVANDFYKMGGFAMFPMCYSSKNEDLRARASSVLGTLCQNNPFCQEKALECGLLHLLLSLVKTEQGNPLAKCLYAISCIVRAHDPACREFIAQGGCPVLVEILNSTELSAKTKAAFLIRYFCEHYPDAKKQFVRNNIVKLLATQLQAGRDESTEHLLSIMQVLVTNREPYILRLFRDPRYNIKKLLEDHLKRPELKDDRYLEEKEYCKELLSFVFVQPQSGSRSLGEPYTIDDEEPADR